MNIFYKYDDKSFVSIVDTKIVNFQSKIDELRGRVEKLERLRRLNSNQINAGNSGSDAILKP